MDNWKTRTKSVHAGSKRSQYNELSEAIYLTQGFVYNSPEEAEARFIKTEEDEFIYARYGNPTVRMFEERIAALENTEDAFATASGMAAVSSALMALVKSGDHVVAAKALFGSCLYVLENALGKFGVDVTFVDGTDLDQWKAAIKPETKCVFFETISNPTLEIIDVAAVSALAHEVGALVMVDNVFATPVFQRTTDLGADVIIYSATKHIDGQGRCLGGVVCGSRDFIRGTLEPYIKHMGAALSPFNAWVMLKGLETIDLRCKAQAQTALEIGQALQGHDKLNRVIHPFLSDHGQHELAKEQMTMGGTMLALEIEGGKDAAFKFLRNLEIILISNNLGDAKSIITHPSTTTHQRLSEEQRLELGITPGLVRLSCGLEDTSDLLNDIMQALDAM